MTNEHPTQAQIEYASKLLKMLGYDIDDYDFEIMSRWGISNLINGGREDPRFQPWDESPLSLVFLLFFSYFCYIIYI